MEVGLWRECLDRVSAALLLLASNMIDNSFEKYHRPLLVTSISKMF